MRWLREPLLHFFIAGAVLFAISIALAPGEMSGDERRIEVSEDTREYLRARFRRVWRRDPTAEEEQRAIDEWVREEVLFREGMALGLANDDPIVRRRVGQKLMMLADAMAPPLPEESELRAWHDERRAEYAAPTVYSFEQRFFGGDDGSERAAAALAAAADSSEPPAGDSTLLPAELADAPASYVTSNFGEAFTEALDELPLARWSGPVVSSFGAHLVRLQTRVEGGPQPFEDVRDDVERDWVYESTNRTRERFYDELRNGYEVVERSGEAAQ